MPNGFAVRIAPALQTLSVVRRVGQAFAGCLAALAMLVLCPQAGRSQAMVRDDPALHTGDTGGPVVSVNGTANDTGDPTVRQPVSGTVAAPAFPAEATLGESNVVDLTGGRGAAVLAERAKWRPIFYLNIGVAYNDNIFISANKVGDFISTLEPGVILALGDFRAALPQLGTYTHFYNVPTDTTTPQRFIYVDYHPSVYLFATHSDQDAVDESATLLGGYGLGKLSLGINAQYQRLSIEDVDAGDRVNRDIFSLNLTSTYQYSDKTSWENNFTAVDREYQAPYTSSSTFASQNYLDYAYGPKTQVSLGVTIGDIDYHSLINQTYQQLRLRVSSVQFAKLDFTADGGIEFRQSGDHDRIDGVFDGGVNFHPTDDTTLSLTATRSTDPSALTNDEVTYTRVSLALQQRFLSRFYMSLSGSYGNADYESVSSHQSLPRTDNLEEIDLGISTDVTQYATVQLSYLFRNSNSTDIGRTFTENIGGLEVRLTY